MPRETIRKLAADVERILIAGAHLAQSDAALEADKAAVDKLVAQLGAKAPPVLGKLAEQTAKTTGARPAEQARELVSLATMVAQVRAAQAQLAPAGESEPLEPVLPVPTPCNAKDLYAVHDALVHSGPGRLEKINEAIERDDVGDLRLVHAVIQAMGDSYGEIAETVSNKVVPAFGRAIVDPIRARLRFPGRAIDGRRLKALVAVEKAGARALVEQALREGSAEMRQAALEAIAHHLPGVPEFEPMVLDLVEKERAGDVRRAAVGALRGYGSDASLEALLAAVDDERTLDEATEALADSKHPRVAERLLARLAAAVEGAGARVKRGDKDGEKAREKNKRIAVALLTALADHEDARIVPAARALIEAFGAAAAIAMLRSATKDDLRALADRLKGDDEGLFAVAAAAAIRLGPDEAFERLSPLLKAKDRDSKLGQARLQALAFPQTKEHREAGFEPSGERWVKALLDAVKAKPRAAHAVTLLGHTRDPRAVEPLLGFLDSEKKSDDAMREIVGALIATGDPRAVDALLRLLGDKARRYSWTVSRGIEELADAGAVSKVRDAVVAMGDKPGGYYLKYLLNRLERKFPGA
jgi:hypothetical protein